MKLNRLCLIGVALLTIFTANSQTAKQLRSLYQDLTVFEDPLATTLKKGVSTKLISKMKDPALKALALALKNKHYDPAYKMAAYQAWLEPTRLGQELMIGDGYSKFEGITGIYLPAGKHVILVDGIAPDREVGLVVPNWTRHAPEGVEPTKDPAGWGIHRQRFVLRNGVNLIELKSYGGLAYIDYYVDDPGQAPPVQVHFVDGQVNGYFDAARNTNEDWNRLIDQAVYPIIDARGRHIQIAYPAADCKQYAYGRGLELIANYDSLVQLQHQLMGLVKYKKVPKNHILARVNYNYYMFRDGDGVAYMGTDPGNAMALVVNPDRVIKGDPCWGFSHEVGHVHQLRPYLNWGGLGEVSNNIFSLYGTTSFGNKSRLSEQKNYQKARDSIIERGICYLQDKDVFNRLVPFWQLQLYFAGAGNNPDFYPDLFEALRQQGNSENARRNGRRRGGGWGDRGSNPAVYQLNFVKTACQVSKTDLTSFFEKYGFFHVGTFKMEDYGNYNYEMTAEMAAACKAEIKAMNLPKPKTDLTLLED